MKKLGKLLEKSNLVAPVMTKMDQDIDGMMKKIEKLQSTTNDDTLRANLSKLADQLKQVKYFTYECRAAADYT